MIRPATEQDIPHIIRMGRLFWSQTAFSHIAYCPDSITYITREMLKMGLLLIAEVEGEIAGAVGAVAAPLFGNRDVLIASELFWWVEPGFRDSGIGKEMLIGIEQVAKEQGVSVFSMMALETVEPEKAAAIYRRLGYIASEHAFSKVL